MTSASLLTSHSLISPPFKFSGDHAQLPATNLRFSQPRVTSSTVSAEKTRSYTHTTLHSPNSSLSLYQILGIPMGATGVEIKSAYRRLARTCHPDVATMESSSAEEFIKIKAAYSTLSDPEKRADYDRMIFRRHRSVLSSSQEPMYSRFRNNGYTTRNWESDQCW